MKSRKSFSIIIGLTVGTSSRMKSYLKMKPFSVNWETTTLLMKTLRNSQSELEIKWTWWAASTKETSKQEMVQFYHHKEIDILKSGFTLPNLANFCLHKSTNEKSERIWHLDHPLCSCVKLSWMHYLSGIHHISANQSLELMQASSIPIQCLKICQQDCTQDGSLIPICKTQD